MCIERYKYAPREITPDLFTFGRILDYREGETNIPRERHVDLLARKDPARLKWIGDKRPAYYKRYDHLVEHNPEAHFLVIFRPVEEVAESFQDRANRPHDRWPHGFEAGVERWNAALRRTREFVEGGSAPVLVIPYHDFFGHPGGPCVPLLSGFLGLEFDEGVLEGWRRMSLNFERKRRPKAPVTEDQRRFVLANKDHEDERWMLDLIERQYAGQAG